MAENEPAGAVYEPTQYARARIGLSHRSVESTRRGSKLATWALRGAGALVAAFLVSRAVLDADLAKTGALLAAAGPAVLLVFLPYLGVLAIDTAAWRRLFAVLGRRVAYAPLLMVRLSAEAINMSLPLGAVFAETMNPVLLKRRCDVPVREAVVGMAAKKWLTMRAHAIYIALSFALGFGLLQAHSKDLIGIDGLPWIVLASALVPLALSAGLASTFVRGSVAERVHDLLSRLPSARLRAWLAKRKEGFVATDVDFERFGKAKGASELGTTALFVVAWLMESIESLLILRVLGAPVGFVEVISFEAGLSLVRCLAFFAPAGLGVQDTGYIAFFAALGLPDAGALGLAFVLLKRSKEILWVIVGYALLFFAPRPALEEAP